ncbi:MAG: hypothetical protein RRC34_14625, partial [Lentisphaeria bacterium]|nr:hypothetical protein [Lentisphaeria bacterium]
MRSMDRFRLENSHIDQSKTAEVTSCLRKATLRGRKLPAPNKMELPNLKKDPKRLSFDIRYS